MIQLQNEFRGIFFFLLVIMINSCTSDRSPEPVDCSTNPVEIRNIASSVATCGLDDGSITIDATGGAGNYQYSLDGTSFQTENKFNDLIAGNYEITVRDGNECIVTSTVLVESEAGMTIDAEVLSDAGCGTDLGRVLITVAGGTSPYQYRYNGDTYQANAELEGLASGSQLVFAKDANDCEVSTVIEVPSGTSLELDILPILTTNCALSGCHDGNGSLPDWSDMTEVINNAANIKTRTGNGSMPPNGSISDNEIEAIACWVDDGALNN